MTRVSHVDQVLLLLHQQLQRSSRQRVRNAEPRKPPQSALDRARALAAMDALGDEATRRAVIRGVLADRLGDAIGNDPGFAAMIDRVDEAVRATPEGEALIAQAVAQLRSG